MAICVCNNKVPADSCAHTVCINCHGELFLNPPPKFDTCTPKLFTLENIKKLCIEYDKENGAYPEDEFQGMDVYQFICTKLDPSLAFTYNDNDRDIWKSQIGKSK